MRTLRIVIVDRNDVTRKGMTLSPSSPAYGKPISIYSSRRLIW